MILNIYIIYAQLSLLNYLTQLNMDTIKNFDYTSKNTKLAASFIVPFVLFFILSPGVFFEINTNEEKKVSSSKKIPYNSAAVHSAIFGVIMCAFYYFYLSKRKVVHSL